MLKTITIMLMIAQFACTRSDPLSNDRIPLADQSRTQGISTTVLGCNGEGREYIATLQSEVLLNLELLKAAGLTSPDKKEALIRQAIDEQINYARGFLVQDASHTEPGKGGLAAFRSKPTLLSEETGPYGAALKIDDFRYNPNGPSYMRAAVARKETQSRDEALRVKYEAEIRYVLCPFEKGSPLRVRELVLPKDPFLTLWYAPPEKRVPMKYGHSKELVSPCAIAEMAEFGNSSEFWYLWSPNQKGKDTDGNSFSCRDAISSEKVLVNAKLKGIEAVPDIPRIQNFASLISADQEILFTGMFGRVEEKELPQLDKEAIRKYFRLNSAYNSELAEKLWKMTFFPGGAKEGRSLEPGANEFLILLKYLPNLIDELKVSVPPEEQSKEAVVLHLRGKLRQSGKSIRIRAYYGSTSIYDKNSGAHWRLFGESLRTDDVFIYNGHAGLGQNVSLENLMNLGGHDEKSVIKDLNKKPYMFVGLLNCYAYWYFGEDILKSRKGQMTDLLLSGTQDVGARYALGVLKMLDRNFSGEKTDLVGSIARYVPERSFMVMKRSNSVSNSL